MAGMSHAEYLRHRRAKTGRGASKRDLELRISAGYISYNKQGKIDPKVADKQWDRYTADHSAGGADPGFADLRQGATSKSEEDPEYLSPKMRRDLAEARLAELKLSERLAELVPRDEIKSFLSELLGQYSEAISNLPTQYSPKIVGISDPSEAAIKLREYNREALWPLENFDRRFDDMVDGLLKKKGVTETLGSYGLTLDDLRSYLISLRKVFHDVLQPDRAGTVWEWADRYRELPRIASVSPGKYKTSRVPYLREIMECLSPQSPVRMIVVMKGVQLGFTEAFHNLLFYLIDSGSGGPIMHVLPSADTAVRNVIQKIVPQLDALPRLKGKMLDGKHPTGSNQRLLKTFVGGMFVSCGANSSAAFRNVSIKTLCLDEVDSYPADCGEGDPVSLAIGRTDAFAQERKIYALSSPTFANSSKIEKMYEESDQCLPYVKAPCCGAYQTLVFEQLRWIEGEPHKGVTYECNSCGERFHEWQKEPWKDKHGHDRPGFLDMETIQWIADRPGYRGGKVRGFRINSLHAPYGMLSWVDIAEKYEDALTDQMKMITFYNTILAKTFSHISHSNKWEAIFNRRESWPIGSIPDPDIALLTCGVDVQGDRFEYSIVGWKAHTRETFVIEHNVIIADTNKDEDWKKLDSILDRQWEVHGKPGFFLSVAMLCVDSSWNSARAYEFARRHQASDRVRAIKGDARSRYIMSQPRRMEYTRTGDKTANTVSAYIIGVNMIKEEVAGWLTLQIQESGRYPERYVHFPMLADEYFKQMCSETLVVRTSKTGKRSYTWEKTNHKRNEAWDTFIYARAAAHAVGVDRFSQSDWETVLADREVHRHEHIEEDGIEAIYV